MSLTTVQYSLFTRALRSVSGFRADDQAAFLVQHITHRSAL